MGTTSSRQAPAARTPTRETVITNRNTSVANDRLVSSGETPQSALSVPEENEYPHLGSVQVDLSWLNPNALRSNDADNSYLVTAKGGIFYGSTAPSPLVMGELDTNNMTPSEYPLLDTRAHQLLIAYDNGWNAISSPEVFSRHTGTCLIIGDRTNQGRGHDIKLGDCFRLGSVGVVVSEMKKPGEKEERLDTKRLQYLREEALHFDNDGDEAILAAKEESGILTKQGTGIPGCNDQEDEMVSPTARDNISGNLFCYMCYESHDTPEDHLVAPCACKGDTRYLHVLCLQKWYQSSLSGWRSLVIRTTGSGAPACKICGMAYKTTLTNLDGVKTNLLEAEHPGPYLSLVVVTRHDTSPELFNTKFRLNFGPGYRIGSTEVNDDPEMNPTELSIGRSSMCNMVLDYRTVSTIHAKLFFREGQFQLQDARSSNGTMLYLQGPLKLPMNQAVRLRMGRSTLAIQARRSLTASIRTVFSKNKLPPCKASLEELQNIMSLAPSMLSKTARMQEKEQLRNSLIPFFQAVSDNDRANNAGSGSRHRNHSNYIGGDSANSIVPHHIFTNSANSTDPPFGSRERGPPQLFITEQMLRDIFRHHQKQLPQGIYFTNDSHADEYANYAASRNGGGVGMGGGSMVLASESVGDIDSPLILGDRPRSQQGSTNTTPTRSQLSPHVSSSHLVEGGGGGGREENTAAVTLPHTSAVYNPGSSSTSSPPPPSQFSTAPRGGMEEGREDMISSVNNLAALTKATLSSVDLEGNALINQTEFLLQLDHQLQTIESCVQEASAAAIATVGLYSTLEDREREHAEMRVQRSIIAQSIQKDAVSGKSIVDNESILLAATVISTKAAAIAVKTTGKESKKAQKVAKRYSVIADKANEMIIKKAIRQSANSTSCSMGNRDRRRPVGGSGLDYEEDEEDVGYSQAYVDPDEQENGQELGEIEDVKEEKEDEKEEKEDRKEEKEDVMERKEDKKEEMEDDTEDKVAFEQARGGGKSEMEQQCRGLGEEEGGEVGIKDAKLDRKVTKEDEKEPKDDVSVVSVDECRDKSLREAQAMTVLEKISSHSSSDLLHDLDESKAREEQEVAMAVLRQAAQAAAVAGGGTTVEVTGEDVDEVVRAIRDICERRRAAAAAAGVGGGGDIDDMMKEKEEDKEEDKEEEVEEERQNHLVSIHGSEASFLSIHDNEKTSSVELQQKQLEVFQSEKYESIEDSSYHHRDESGHVEVSSVVDTNIDTSPVKLLHTEHTDMP